VLSPLEQKFVSEFLKTGNAALAVVHSGIRDGRGPDKIAESLLMREDIRAAIESAAPMETPVVALDKDVVLAEIQEIQDLARGENRYSEALNAIKLKTDVLGLRTTKVEVVHNKSIKDMSDDDLLAILEKAGRKDLLK